MMQDVEVKDRGTGIMVSYELNLGASPQLE